MSMQHRASRQPNLHISGPPPPSDLPVRWYSPPTGAAQPNHQGAVHYTYNSLGPVLHISQVTSHEPHAHAFSEYIVDDVLERAVICLEQIVSLAGSSTDATAREGKYALGFVQNAWHHAERGVPLIVDPSWLRDEPASPTGTESIMASPSMTSLASSPTTISPVSSFASLPSTSDISLPMSLPISPPSPMSLASSPVNTSLTSSIASLPSVNGASTSSLDIPSAFRLDFKSKRFAWPAIMPHFYPITIDSLRDLVWVDPPAPPPESIDHIVARIEGRLPAVTLGKKKKRAERASPKSKLACPCSGCEKKFSGALQVRQHVWSGDHTGFRLLCVECRTLVSVHNETGRRHQHTCTRVASAEGPVRFLLTHVDTCTPREQKDACDEFCV